MATHKSAEKRARTAARRKNFNNSTKNSVRTAEKRVRSSVSAKNTDSAAQALSQFASAIMKAKAKGVVHYKTAARKIARLAKSVSALSK